MPIPAQNLNDVQNGQEIVSYLERKSSKGTGCAMVILGSTKPYDFFHRDLSSICNASERTVEDLYSSKLNKKFIAFQKLFKKQFDNLTQPSEGFDFEMGNAKLSSSLSCLLDINPDLISMELTNEQSIFYSIQKDDYSFYLQYFLNEVEEDDDEAILTVFKGNDKLPSYAGSLYDTISELYNILSIYKPLKIQLELNELSV